ncbi:MAG: exopolysaccharide biosynthesis polyprenyl glycosylphosphotransferase [Acidimicrobiales bacterium]
MTVAEHPSAYGRFDAEADFRTRPRARLLPSGHRAAAWLHAAITGALLVVAGLVWRITELGGSLRLAAVTVVVVFAMLLTRGHFRVRMVPDTLSRLPLIIVAVATGGSAALVAATTPWFSEPQLGALVQLLGLVAVAAVAGQTVGTVVVRWQWRRGRLRAAAVVFGSDDLAREMAVEINLRREYGVDVVGTVPGWPFSVVGGNGRVDHTAELARVVRQTGADRLIISPAATSTGREIVRAARWATGHGLAVYIVPRLYEMGVGMDSMNPDQARGYPLVRVGRAAHPRLSLIVKRLVDIVVAGGVLVVTLPIALAVAALVKATSPGPVLFTQVRVGQHGRRILIHKFRSMTTSPGSDTEWTADERVTAVGEWLRRLNIDELPQLWSILKGDMSLVGPRPERPAFVARFRAEIDGYDDRHRMPVGLTGLAQVAGLRGDTSIAERVKYDNLYIDQWSFGADVQILAKTVMAVLFQRRYAQRVDELEAAISGVVPPPDRAEPKVYAA